MRKLTPDTREDAVVSRQVVAVLLSRQDRVALLRRSARVGHEAGAWHCVTGYLDDGMEPRRQAMAELREETGLDGLDVESLTAGPTLSLPDSRDNRPWTVHPFAAGCRRTRLTLNWENDEYRWVRRADLPLVDGQVTWLAHVVQALTRPLPTSKSVVRQRVSQRSGALQMPLLAG